MHILELPYILKMITNKDFNDFLKSGFFNGLPINSSLAEVTDKYGHDNWTIKETENNGLTYGVMIIGMTEFHIYDEKLIGINFRTYLYDKNQFKDSVPPWICSIVSKKDVIKNLTKNKISFNEYTVQGPKKSFITAGVELTLEQGIHTIIDTEGDVSFLFEESNTDDGIRTYRVCKYLL